MYQLIWFRCDLRTIDNTALIAARQRGPTLALYLLSPQQRQQHHDAPCKVDFWRRQLTDLSERLNALNIPLLIRTASHWSEAPHVISALCQIHAIKQVHVNIEFGVNERARDHAVQQALTSINVPMHLHQDRTLFPPGSITTQQGQPFQVFGAFKRMCYARLQTAPVQVQPALSPQAPLPIAPDNIPPDMMGYNPSSANHWRVGEQHAQEKLHLFVTSHLARYDQERDFPALNHTSQLSPYLNAGILSVRQCVVAAQAQEDGPGAQAWMDELLWREFYQHLLAAYPALSKGQAFYPAKEPLWRHAPGELNAWQAGRTGFPLIDAAMRQLLATGWMHNRLRMVVAMFLCKNLLIDWRLGERWFMQHLIDGDLAANNGGWQWCASTGTDAVPYFRLFNPVTQSKRFDPHGDFIRTWIPELAHLNARMIHEPYASSSTKQDSLTSLFAEDYPQPMVDLAFSRSRALAAYQQLGQIVDHP